MATITVHRQTERIEVKDEDGGVAFALELRTDDGSLERMLAETQAALDDYQRSVPDGSAAEGDDAAQAAARMQRRCITSIAGEDGYHETLAYIGGGAECDPAENLNNVGEVWGALMVWLYDRVARSGIADAAEYLGSQARRRRQQKGRR